jgi:hypothetical protein
MSVVLAWWGVSVVGEQVTTRRDSPFAEEAIDVPPSTSAPQETATTEPTLPAQIDPGAAAAITSFLDAPTSTTAAPLLLPPETPPTTAARPRTTTVPTASPTTGTTTPDETTTPTSVAPTTPATTASPTTAPPTTASTAPPASSTTIPVDRGITTTTAPATTTTTSGGSTTSTSPFPPGWDDRAGFEPKENGQTTYRFNCGSFTIHWNNFEVVNVTGEIYDDRRSCVERYGGAQLAINVLDSGETEFVVTYPNGKVDRYVMPAPPPHD